MTGSGPAEAAALGILLIPSMVESNYKRGYAASLLASAGSLGIIIPPSIPMVIYSSLTDVSVGNLFLAGFLPGILIGLILMTFNYVMSSRRGYKGTGKHSLKEIGRAFRGAILPLFMPLIIVGGIYGGNLHAHRIGCGGGLIRLLPRHGCLQGDRTQRPPGDSHQYRGDIGGCHCHYRDGLHLRHGGHPGEFARAGWKFHYRHGPEPIPLSPLHQHLSFHPGLFHERDGGDDHTDARFSSRHNCAQHRPDPFRHRDDAQHRHRDGNPSLRGQPLCDLQYCEDLH